MRHPKPTPAGAKALRELDEFVEKHRDVFEKIAANLRARKRRLS